MLQSVDTPDAISDEALALAAKDDGQAFPVLVRRYRQLISHIANHCAENSADAEDYAQEGLIGLLAAVSSYAPGHHASFRTYAAVCIRNRILNAVRANGSGQVAALSLDDPNQPLDELLTDDSDSPEQVFLQKERVSSLYAQLADVLSKQETEILLLAAGGLSYGEIAGRLHISEKSVDNALQRARRKLRTVRSGRNPADNDSR